MKICVAGEDIPDVPTTVTYNKNIDAIVLLTPTNHEYTIELNRINTKGEIVSWVHHLSEKSWVTTLMIGDFIKKVCEVKKWNPYK